MLHRHLTAVLVVLTLTAATPACDQGRDNGSLLEEEEAPDEGSRDPYAPQSWKQRADAEPEPQAPPPAPSPRPLSERCGQETTYWVGTFRDTIGTSNQFDLTLAERPVAEFILDNNPCVGMVQEPTHALIGHTGPAGDEPGEVNGLRDQEQICFTVGESYGMQIYRGWFDEEDCTLGGSFAGHSGSYPFDVELSE